MRGVPLKNTHKHPFQEAVHKGEEGNVFPSSGGGLCFSTDKVRRMEIEYPQWGWSQEIIEAIESSIAVAQPELDSLEYRKFILDRAKATKMKVEKSLSLQEFSKDSPC